MAWIPCHVPSVMPGSIRTNNACPSRYSRISEALCNHLLASSRVLGEIRYPSPVTAEAAEDLFRRGKQGYAGHEKARYGAGRAVR